MVDRPMSVSIFSVIGPFNAITEWDFQKPDSDPFEVNGKTLINVPLTSMGAQLGQLC